MRLRAVLCLCLSLPFHGGLHARAEKEETKEALEEKINLLKEENELFREKARAAEDLHRIMKLQEDAHGQAEARNQAATEMLERDLERERRLRLQRESELRMLRGNLIYPGAGYAREGHPSRALFWGGTFLLSLGGFLFSYHRQQSAQNELHRHTLDPIGQPAAQKHYDEAYRQTVGLGALTAAVYVAGAIDVFYKDRGNQAVSEPQVRLGLSMRF